MSMTAAERVRLSRWINRVEQLSDDLLTQLQEAPDPLPRAPLFSPELVERLSQYVAVDDVSEDEQEVPRERFLKLGNGNQAANRDLALRACERLIPELEPVDRNTIEWRGIGVCHFAAFTHPKGAMISSTKSEDASFGGALWHAKEAIAMFRDSGDGRCFVYVCPIEPLFALRTIGQHGVRWEDVQRVALKTVVLRSVDALDATA